MQPDTNQSSDTNSQPAGATPPVFHNPLAQGYTDRTAQLPDLTSGQSLPVQPTTDVNAAPQPVVSSQQTTPTTPLVSIPPSESSATPAALFDVPGAASGPESDIDTPLIPDPTPIQPAPVRLAQDPKTGSFPLPATNVPPHLTAPAQGTTNQAASLSRTNVPKQHPIRRLLIILAVVFVLLIGGFVGWRVYQQRAVVQPTPSTAVTPVRDTAVKALASGYERLETACYSLQIPNQPRVDVNKDCQLSVFYGTQKVSSVVVSTFRDFDFVAEDTTQASSSPSAQRFDSKRVLDALITNATTGKAISARQDIKIGNIDAVKVVGAAQAGGDPVYVNVFIVLPESDQQFAEKNFIAFTITGAYNDSYSRKTFDHVIDTWSWK
ncbi:hypothetical protein IT415_02975 [bacterium]|nr:hypothetical protein [bacterium]